MDPKKEHLKKYLEELEQIESLLKKRKDESGILYYTPNPKQYKFHCSKAKRILYVGSNRSGKTESAMAELVMHATGLYPDWYPEHKRRDIPQKILWVSPTFEHIQNFVEPKFEKLVPKESIVGKPRRHSYGYLAQVDVKHSSGGISQVFFKSQEQKLMSFEGSDYDIAISDEPLSRPLYSSIVRGLVDRGGIMIFTLTPIEQQWMKEELCDRADGKFIEMFVADIHDNLFDIKGKPILNKQYIKEFEDSIPEEEREIRIHGRWYHLSGIVFKEIEPSVHKIEDHKVPKDCPVISVTDPHDRNPHWTIWAYVDKTDDVFICGELIATGSPEEYAAKMLAHEKYMGWRVKRRIIDPNFGNKPKSVGSRIRVVDQFRSAGLRGMILGIDDDEAGKFKIREYLKYDKRKPVDISNKPKLYFFKDGARETFRAVSNLQYDDWAKHLHDMKELKESVRDKNKHACFVFDTLVETAGGDVPIANISVGHNVKTSSGYCKVLSIAKTKRNDIVRVLFSNGSIIDVTPEHGVYTLFGIKRVVDLKYNDIIQTRINNWKKQNLITKIIDGMVSILWLVLVGIGYTLLFGSFIMAKLFVGITYTIKILILRTTKYLIYNVCQNLNIYHSTPEETLNSPQNKLLNTWKKSDHSQKNGMVLNKEENGIANTLRKLCRINPSDNLYVPYVGNSIILKNLPGLSFVLEIAEQLIGVDYVKTLILRESVLFAENSFSRIGIHHLIPVHAIAVLKTGKEEHVFNMTVDKSHNFYANNILVKNCDTLRYLLVSNPTYERGNRHEEEIDKPIY